LGCSKDSRICRSEKDYLYDIAALTGATVISSETGSSLDSATIEHFGSCRSVIVKQRITLQSLKAVERLILWQLEFPQAKAMLSQVESDYEAKIITERIAKMSGGVAVIRVGASTEAEMGEKKHRYEDALAATRAAVEEGIVPGGGTTLLKISESLE
jgi:chaperonin GroEL